MNRILLVRVSKPSVSLRASVQNRVRGILGKYLEKRETTILVKHVITVNLYLQQKDTKYT